MFYKFEKPEALPPTSDTLRFHLMREHAHCATPEPFFSGYHGLEVL